LKATAIDLQALFRGEDPFSSATAQVSRDDANIASSKPNDFKDFGEQ
jgi:hypothetical protein